MRAEAMTIEDWMNSTAQEVYAVVFDRKATFEEVFAAYLEVPVSELGDIMIGNGPEDAQSIEDIKAAGVHGGIFGFCHQDATPPTVHYWFDPAVATEESLISFFAHEMSHAVIDPLIAAEPPPDPPDPDDPSPQEGGINRVLSEVLAETVGLIASRAVSLTREASRRLTEPRP